jgi:hypothetical protein
MFWKKKKKDKITFTQEDIITCNEMILKTVATWIATEKHRINAVGIKYNESVLANILRFNIASIMTTKGMEMFDYLFSDTTNEVQYTTSRLAALSATCKVVVNEKFIYQYAIPAFRRSLMVDYKIPEDVAVNITNNYPTVWLLPYIQFSTIVS